MVALLYALVCLIWGSTWVAIKIGLEGVPPFLGAGLRFAVSALVLAVPLLVRRRWSPLTRDDKICVFSLGVLIFWIDYACVYWAEMHITSGLTAVLFSTMPLTTALMSAFWMRSEVLGARKTAGILIGVAGTALLFWPNERLGAMQVAGMVVALIGSICASVNLVLIKKYGQNGDAVRLNCLGMVIGAAALLATSAAVESWRTVVWSRSNVAALLYLALVGSVIAFSVYYWLIRRLDATVVSLAQLVIPIVALALGRVFLNETVTTTAVLGIVTVLAGVGIALLPGAKPNASGAFASVPSRD
ncbi:MAG TPA: EamA family transporter [Vicinamibacterales bacterium]|jgi:drug/metabolite transporter (DMT)-like permease|nr:EamA family transporter [Vicinamibacterales bacterium]